MKTRRPSRRPQKPSLAGRERSLQISPPAIFNWPIMDLQSSVGPAGSALRRPQGSGSLQLCLAHVLSVWAKVRIGGAENGQTSSGCWLLVVVEPGFTLSVLDLSTLSTSTPRRSRPVGRRPLGVWQMKYARSELRPQYTDWYRHIPCPCSPYAFLLAPRPERVAGTGQEGLGRFLPA
jgi:hypothetical protein